MAKRPPDIKKIEDWKTLQIYDENKTDWQRAYNTKYKRVINEKVIENQEMSNLLTTVDSRIVDVGGFSNCLLLIDILWINTPTAIIISSYFSPERVNFFKFAEDIWNDLRYVPAQGNIKECITIPILPQFMLIKITGAGLTAVNKAVVSIGAILND